MSHPRRWPHLLFVVVLIIVSLGSAPPQTVKAASTYTVNTAIDIFPDASNPDGGCNSNPAYPGACSLRQAINDANRSPGSTIEFKVPPNTPGYRDDSFTIPGTPPILYTRQTWTITPTVALPAIAAASTLIDGFSQAAFIGGNPNRDGPEIIISGGIASNPAPGDPITTVGGIFVKDGADGSTIKGLGFINFAGPNEGLVGVGIEVKANNVTLQGNYLGTNGYRTQQNNDFGIWLRGNGATVGGDGSGRTDEFNVISGNNKDGILIEGGSNKVRGNLIGVTATGDVKLPNGGNGIQIRRSPGGNVIGVDPANPGQKRIYRNVISGNVGYGIQIVESAGNSVYGNRIGLSDSATQRLGNTAGGIQIISFSTGSPSENNVIGGANEYTRNFIAGNGGPGINIIGIGARSNTVTNNYIGLGLDGYVPAGSDPNNQGGGIKIERGSSGNTIGGPFGDVLNQEPSWQRNVISGNDGDGITIQGFYDGAQDFRSNSNVIAGNFIGTDIFGTGPSVFANLTSYKNQGDGIEISTNVRSNRVGDAAFTRRNLIGYNTARGVLIAGPAYGGEPTTTQPRVRDTILQKNEIFFNGSNGVELAYAYNTTIDGIDASERTLIYANTLHGIQITGGIITTIQYVRLSENGTGPSGGSGLLGNSGTTTTTLRVSQVLTNTLDGISLSATKVNTLESLLVRGNLRDGVAVVGGNKHTLIGSFVFSNTLGVYTSNTLITAIDSNRVEYNRSHGIQIAGTGVSNQTSITNNYITRNSGTAVLVQKSGSGLVDQVKITNNFLTRNGAAIDLDPSSPAPGVATNPNHDIDPPLNDLSSRLRIRLTQGGLLSGYVLTSTVKTLPPSPAAACISCTIQVFRTDPTLPAPDGQGYVKLGEATPDEVGRFQVQLSGVPPLPPQILLTATDGYNNTSEYTAYFKLAELVIAPDRIASAEPGQTITYTHRVTNTGTIDLDVALTAQSSLGWEVKVAPASANLPADSSMPVTVTVTLPTGSASNVRAGLVDVTTVTVKSTSTDLPEASDFVEDRTTVLERFVLSAEPPSRTGFGPPKTTIPYVYTLRNNGNITGTVQIAATTLVGSLATWQTQLTPTIVTLAPGQQSDVTTTVAIPDGAQQGTVGRTTIDVDVQGTTIHRTLVATTTVTVDPQAIMFPNRSGDAGATETIRFFHTVENRSNGSATFRLNYGSSLGSQAVFGSNTPGIAISNGNTFTLSNVSGSNVFNFYVDITVNAQAVTDQLDLVTIYLTDTQGTSIGGASVQDTIRVARGVFRPRLWMPVARR